MEWIGTCQRYKFIYVKFTVSCVCFLIVTYKLEKFIIKLSIISVNTSSLRKALTSMKFCLRCPCKLLFLFIPKLTTLELSSMDYYLIGHSKRWTLWIRPGCCWSPFWSLQYQMDYYWDLVECQYHGFSPKYFHQILWSYMRLVAYYPSFFFILWLCNVDEVHHATSFGHEDINPLHALFFYE